MIIKKEIKFNATMEQVWNLLTNPEMTKKYMFGCEVISDWSVGDKILWNVKTDDGSPKVIVKGNITDIDPGKSVRFSMIDPNMGIADVIENYVYTTYDLMEESNGTTLVLTQGDFSTVDLGKKRYEDAIGGWDMVIGLMKEILP